MPSASVDLHGQHVADVVDPLEDRHEVERSLLDDGVEARDALLGDLGFEGARVIPSVVHSLPSKQKLSCRYGKRESAPGFYPSRVGRTFSRFLP